VWEENLLERLLEDLEGHVWNEEQDGWVWKRDEHGRFTVKSMYAKLETLIILENTWGEEEQRVFTQLWKSPTLSKVALSWKMLLDRIPTRVNLRRRNVLPPKLLVTCALCDRETERTKHLFMHCSVAHGVWLELFN